MSIKEYLWQTRVTVANILHHARLISEGWTCRRLISIEVKKRKAIQKIHA